MKTSIFYIIAILVTTISCGTLQGQEKNLNAIVKMEITSMNFNVRTRINWSWEQLWATRSGNDIFRTAIIDQSFLDSANAYIEHITSQRPITENLDTRIACLIYRKNGITDSLGIDNFDIELNNKQYPIYRPLLLLIADRLPEDQRQSIKRSIEIQDDIQRRKQNGTYQEEDWEKEQDE